VGAINHSKLEESIAMLFFRLAALRDIDVRRQEVRCGVSNNQTQLPL